MLGGRSVEGVSLVGRVKTLPEGTYVVAVCSLYTTLTPSLVMAIAFTAVGVHIAMKTPDPLLAWLVALGVAAMIVRLGVLIVYRAKASAEELDLPAARKLERLFAIPYLTFAATFGAFSARSFQLANPETHMLVIGLLFGYAAGVVAGIFMRPGIAIPSLVLAGVPTSVVAPTGPNITDTAAGGAVLLFLGAAVRAAAAA